MHGLLPPVLYRSDRLLVINKPAGMAVTPGRKGGPSVEDFFPQFSRRRDGPWLVHRLDTDTAGCLVVALRRAALLEAQAEFAAGRAEKIYWAIVQGGPAADHGTVDAGLIKISSKQAGWRMAIAPAGQRAITEWRVLGRAPGRTWLELRPRTGRTHQIRVHCASLGCPLLGDPVYGAGEGKLQLLARAITLRLEPEVVAVAAPPPHMADLLSKDWG
jgi:RluA family pseudouridine synthase